MFKRFLNFEKGHVDIAEIWSFCLLLYLSFIPRLSVSDVNFLYVCFLYFIHVLCHFGLCVIVFYADQVSNKDIY